MPASLESVSDDGGEVTERAVICGLNWLGDSIMSMPAIQAFLGLHPGLRLTLLVKPGLADLWRLHEGVNDVVPMEPGLAGVFRTVRALKRRQIPVAYVLPNSTRSALIPFLARVPERVGARGRQRACLLTRVVEPGSTVARRHQSWEYIDILGLDATTCAIGPPRLSIPQSALDRAEVILGAPPGTGPLVGLIPGAARGPSKQWPAERFGTVGRTLAREAGCRVLVFGSGAERAVCGQVAAAAGASARSLAGSTSLAELAALLARCRVVVANDSGGMHLAAAVGVRVVAIYGITDPAVTGPLGAGHRVIGSEYAARSRDIARHSAEAERSLRSIRAEQVSAAALDVLGT